MPLCEFFKGRNQLICIVCRALLILISVIAASQKVLAQDFPADLRDLICSINEKPFKTKSNQKRHSYPNGAKQTKYNTFTGESYWVCLATGQIYLVFKSDGRPNLILDEFIATKRGIFAVRTEGPSLPTRRYKWNSNKTKLSLMSIEADVRLRSRNSSGEPTVKKGGSLRATGHTNFRKDRIDIETFGPVRPVLVKYEETTAMDLDNS